MTGTYFETFMVGGLALLVVAALAVAWLLWRQADTRREAIALSLEGIGHEFRFNMFQTVNEIRDVAETRIRSPEDLPRLAHPQLDALLAEIVATDKRALAAVQATYQNVEVAKRSMRMALADGEKKEPAMQRFKAAAIDGISTLYLWENHEGRPPQHARSTRSWWVRDWMKAHGFTQDLMPGLALRDAVVDNLRGAGMVLTPRPLALTAHEYYSRKYSREADPRGIFGKRRRRKDEAAVPDEAPDEAEAYADVEEDAFPAEAAAPVAAAAAVGHAELAPAPDEEAGPVPEADAAGPEDEALAGTAAYEPDSGDDGLKDTGTALHRPRSADAAE